MKHACSNRHQCSARLTTFLLCICMYVCAVLCVHAFACSILYHDMKSVLFFPHACKHWLSCTCKHKVLEPVGAKITIWVIELVWFSVIKWNISAANTIITATNPTVYTAKKTREEKVKRLLLRFNCLRQRPYKIKVQHCVNYFHFLAICWDDWYHYLHNKYRAGEPAAEN